MQTPRLERVPRFASPQDVAGLEARLERLFEPTHGLRAWLGTVDHKKLGVLYIVTAFVFLLAGGIEALVLRVQLAFPSQRLLSPEAYNQLFTMHGMTMIFLYSLPVLSGIAIYVWPLMLGARDLAFPRLNALTYWTYLFSGLFLYSTLPIGLSPNAGWFNYVPLSAQPYNPGPGIDVFALGMVLLGFSTTGSSINFIATLARLRAPGMSINRMPILVWGTVTASVGNLFMLPAVSLCFFLLHLDRNYGMHVYSGYGGGPLLWQHIFWFFGHPWVYALVLPAMGIASDGLPTFCRRPLVGYTFVALSTVATMMIGYGVWTHHMFATGLSPMANSLIGAASITIAIPSAIGVFAWIATIWTGRPVITTAFLHFAAMIFLFVAGGVTGVMTAAVALDWQLHDTYFVVAHLHYVLLGINLFPVLGGIYYWFPKMSGRMLDETLGKIGFWLSFIGFNIAFFPMHLLGLLGMPRRIYTYETGLGWDRINLVITVGAFLLALGIAVFLFNVARSLRHGRVAGNDPWGGGSLEWSTTSPPPAYNFAVIPFVASRHPLWENALDEGPQRSVVRRGFVLDAGKETAGTTLLDGMPYTIVRIADETYVPLALAVAITLFFVALLFKALWIAAACIIAMIALTGAWMWPRAELGQRRAVRHE
ncbi:MAG: cytochrome ubiquinol oxidase subunit I [Hyphomicrobiales bacterium]|nr:MAG: cytochrome ubiquinol oxidase subunit I [Hyphomicrobiales bacterium]